MPIILDDLRRYAVARSLFPPTTLQRAIERLGFVQADPIRAPARAQDLTLRHRVVNYRAGDLERRFATLAVEEDTFINYGFLPRAVHAMMHPRGGTRGWTASRRRRAQLLLDFIRGRGTVHPRELDAHFSHGNVTNAWGGSSNATTHLLDHLLYAGLVRVARREGGIRIYAALEPPPPLDAVARRQRVDALVDLVVHAYAPVPGKSLPYLVSRLRYAVPQWTREIKSGALQRARQRLSTARVDGADWYWPVSETVARLRRAEAVRFLSPFDPIVWDRRRFELFWGWAYRFEAYTPVPKRKLGYYALPLLWRDDVIGWANVAVRNGALDASVGYVGSAPRDRAFKNGLDAEMERMRLFLGLSE